MWLPVYLAIAVAVATVQASLRPVYKRPSDIDVDPDSRRHYEERFRTDLPARRHLICPGAHASISCPIGTQISLLSATARPPVEQRVCTRSQGDDRSVDSNCLASASSAALDKVCPNNSSSTQSCVITSGDFIELLTMAVSNATRSHRASSGECLQTRLDKSLAVTLAWLCQPTLHYLLVCSSTRRIIECGVAEQVTVVHAIATNRYRFVDSTGPMPQMLAHCPDTVAATEKAHCSNKDLAGYYKDRCQESGGKCEINTVQDREDEKCADRHVLVIYACVPRSFYAAQREVVADSKLPTQDTSSAAAASAGSGGDRSLGSPPASGRDVLDVALNDQGKAGGSAAAAATASGGANLVQQGQETDGERTRGEEVGGQGRVGNEKEDIILISAAASVVAALLVATCAAFAIVLLHRRRQGRRQSRRRSRRLDEVKETPDDGSARTRLAFSGALTVDLDSADQQLHQLQVIATNSGVERPPLGGCYLLPTPPMGQSSLPSLEVAPAAATTTASPHGSLSSEAASGYATASVSSSSGGTTVRFSQFSDMYFYQPNSCPSPLSGSVGSLVRQHHQHQQQQQSARVGVGGGLEGVAEEPPVYTPRGISYF